MSAFFIYLFKVSAWIAAWWLIYYFFLRKEKFYTFNRIYLMAGLAASLLIPLLKFHYPVEVFAPQIPAAAVAENIQAPAHPVDIYSVLFYIYTLCALLFSIRQVFLILKIKNIIRSAGYTAVDNYRFVDSPKVEKPFSFLNYIFLNFRQIPEAERQLILVHERSHIFQRHWLDLVIADIIHIFLWFNPFMWFYLRAVKENHEYLADEAVIRSGYSPASYLAVLINQSLNIAVFPLVNTFTHYKFKRISMMKKETSNPLKKLAVTLLLPAACFFFWAFSEPEYHVTTVEPVVTIHSEQVKNEAVIVTVQDVNKPSEDSTIRVDGVQKKKRPVTVYKGSEPLYLIDGKETTLSGNEIDPDQIESVEIFKDSSAVKFFGVKGKNGVVNITTKRNQPAAVADTTRVANVVINRVMPDKRNMTTSIFTRCEDSPMFIVDGKETAGDVINQMNPKEIESVSVLKNENATSIYGEKGKNGVVIITTKK